MKELVVLVDEQGRDVGRCEKIEAHKRGLLHRAFSIFIFNSKGELLLQKRSQNKYHSPGLWSNTCCSHPRPEEDFLVAAHRRLVEEMGFDCELKEVFSFLYKVTFDNGLCEHEYDHVFVGTYDGLVTPNLQEVEDYKWITLDDLKKDIHRQIYTYWLQKIMQLDKI